MEADNPSSPSGALEETAGEGQCSPEVVNVCRVDGPAGQLVKEEDTLHVQFTPLDPPIDTTLNTSKVSTSPLLVSAPPTAPAQNTEAAVITPVVITQPVQVVSSGTSVSTNWMVGVSSDQSDDDVELNAAVLSLLSDLRPQPPRAGGGGGGGGVAAVTAAAELPPAETQPTLQQGSGQQNGHGVDDDEDTEREYWRRLQMREVEEEQMQAGSTGEEPLPSQHDARARQRARTRFMANMPYQLNAFGRYVADELDSMSVEEAVEAKAKIMKILMEARLE